MPAQKGASCAGALLLCFAAAGVSQGHTERGEKSVEVTLEVRRGGVWQAIDPHTVLHGNDEIQFHFHSSYGGYLYVFNVSGAGKGEWMYPRPEQQQSNRIEPGARYVIPGQQGSFVIGGDPGYDTTYWIISPTAMDVRNPGPPPVAPQPNTLRPRCGETLLKARGLCLDDRAGPGPVPDLKKLPLPQDGGSNQLVARDLTFHAKEDSTRIAAPDSSAGIIVYQFLIAHQ